MLETAMKPADKRVVAVRFQCFHLYLINEK